MAGSCMQDAGQGYQLTLAHGDAAALFAHFGLQAIFQRVEPVAAADARRHGPHFLVGGRRPCIANVVGHAAGKEEGRLRHDAQLPAIAGQVERADIHVIDQEHPTLELVEAGHQLAQARLACARVPHQRHRLARRDGQAEVAQHLLLFGVAEIHAPEFDAPGQAAHRLVVQLHDPRLGVDEGKDPLAGRHAQLKLAPEGGDAGEGEPEEADALHEKKPVAGRHLAAQHTQAAKVDDQRRADARHRVQDREDAAEDKTLAQVDAIGLLVDGRELVEDGLFLAKGLGDGDAGHRLLDLGVHLGQHPARLLGGVARQPPKEKRHQR